MKKSFKHITNIFALSAFLCGVSSCSDHDLESLLRLSDDDIINIGGIDRDDMLVTSRVSSHPAEEEPWLVKPLTDGLDITYGLVNAEGHHTNQDVAILKLTDKTTTPATYTFKYRADRSATVGEGNDAIWYDNGYHYFQGVHVPERIRYTGNISEVESAAPGLVTDQHDDNATGEDTALGNHTLLAHYLGMPADCKITATIERIRLPFRHRLARVVAFVLIDPELNTTLKGYKKNAEGNTVDTEDPQTTSLRFNNVFVLQGVHDQVTDGHHTLTPEWVKARKVIPHFDGEKGSYSYKDGRSFNDNFILYTKLINNNEREDVYPTDDKWQGIHTASDHKGYTEINYGKVPVYDIIVRPTYTDAAHVMYDESGYVADDNNVLKELASHINAIDFEIALENGLNYEKHFEFDLDANFQTVVYLRISRQQVDYNDAGSELWIENTTQDDWYGVDNENGNTLSMAGSSWQRAYRTKKLPDTDKVTDGDFYDNGEDVGQYLNSTAKWTELLIQACEGGRHHGDYFVLDEDITIDARMIPADFVFTGHLDAQDKTITLTGTGTDAYDVTTDYTNAELYYKRNTADADYLPFKMPDHLYVCEEIAQAKPHKADAGTYIPSGPEMMTEVSPTLSDVMGNTTVYYEKDGNTYRIWNPRAWTFYTKRTSAGALFCGLDGTYITAQESAADPYSVAWEANVHLENKGFWVPTAGYRAEVLNAVVKGGTLFSEGAVVTGNVQNCFNMDGSGTKTAVTNTPNIPQYK